MLLFRTIHMRVWDTTQQDVAPPQSIEEALLNNRASVNVPERFDFTNLSDHNRALAEKYLFIQCVQKCGYGDTRICDMSPANVEQLRACLRQYGYELEFLIDGTDALYRFHSIVEDSS